jgi:hypothetical protein
VIIENELIRKNLDEVAFLEYFNITVDDLIDVFWEKILERSEDLWEEFGDGITDETEE